MQQVAVGGLSVALFFVAKLFDRGRSLFDGIVSLVARAFAFLLMVLVGGSLMSGSAVATSSWI